MCLIERRGDRAKLSAFPVKLDRGIPLSLAKVSHLASQTTVRNVNITKPRCSIMDILEMNQAAACILVDASDFRCLVIC